MGEGGKGGTGSVGLERVGIYINPVFDGSLLMGIYRWICVDGSMCMDLFFMDRSG